jgi:hypothetical protein
VSSPSEEETQTGILESVDICTRLGMNASFILRFIHTFKRLPTVSEVVGVGCFMAHTVSSTSPHISDSDQTSLPLQNMISKMSRAWEKSESDRTQTAGQDSNSPGGSDEKNEDGQGQGSRKRKRY